VRVLAHPKNESAHGYVSPADRSRAQSLYRDTLFATRIELENITAPRLHFLSIGRRIERSIQMGTCSARPSCR